MSYGQGTVNSGYGYSQAEKDGIDALGAAGIIVVAIAHNFYQDIEASPIYPASYESPNIIAVAASTPQDRMADFSDWGRVHVDLAAPGAGTTNIMLVSGPGSRDYTSFWGGTSASAPHVVGAVALLAGAYPEATVAQIKSAILETVDVIEPLQGMMVTSGRLNVARALLHLSTNRPPVFIVPPQGRSVFPGLTTSLSTSVGGTVPLAYQWFQGSNTIDGATNALLTLTNVLSSQAGLWVQVSNAFGAITSAPVQVFADPTSPAIIYWGACAWGKCDIPPDLTNFVSLAGGRVHSLALLRDGTVRAWGGDKGGQSTMPPGLGNVRQISAGAYFSIALHSNGTVTAWGRNSEGQVTGAASQTEIASISAGQFHCLAVRSNGTVAAWGWNSKGQCNVPSGLVGVAVVKGGYEYSLALLSDGTVVAWGDNAYGQCNVPSGLSDVTAVVAGAYASMAMKHDGTVVVWGNNTYGQLDLPPGLTNVVAVDGYSHFLCLKRDGTVVSWGAGITNRLTGGDWGQAIVPPGLSNVVAVASNGRHSLAVLAIPAPPRLLAQLQGTNMVLSWPESAAGWQLLSATSLAPLAVWQPWATALRTNNGSVSTPVPVGEASRFFRLRSP
jgi:alpha-tubulin suppressor-like RCC1 family protein